MPKKKFTKIDNDNDLEHNITDDIVLEDDSEGVSDKIKKIQKKLKECEKERQEYLDGWQRARADAVNKEKETVLERERAVSRAEIRAYSELFPVLDSFDMAFSNKELWEKVDKDWRVGIEHIYTQAIRIFESAGISTIDAEGVLDPHLHEPIQVKEVDAEKDDGHILSVVQKGYIKGELVLRPAKVIIGKFK
ncbi:nucleotide exchange factor GrpE [Candidatus Kaiserbacteria bacterium]|nr:nucleotide exchange factor GrpE [Candidatus Kaiserbacteria bacterium]